MIQRRTLEEKRELIEKIDEDRKSGIHFEQAMKKHGISAGSYYTYKSQLKESGPVRKPKTPKLIQIEAAPRSERLYLLMGSPREIAEFLSHGGAM